MTWRVRTALVSDVDADQLLVDYFVELIARYYDRPAEEAEARACMVEFPSEDLVEFVVGSLAGRPSGCCGFRLVSDTVGEVSRMYVRPQARRTGGAAAMLTELERRAVARGLTTLRLDTRDDLVEARALYAKLGYVEGPPHNEDPYAEHWFSKQLLSAGALSS